jgi:GAF domain-containing protein
MQSNHEPNADPGLSSSVPGLVASLSELGSLIVATDALDEVLWETAMLGVRASDEADACGVTVLRDGRPVSILPSTTLYTELEEHQYAHNDGPAIEAMRTRQPVRVAEMKRETRWQNYPALAASHGIGSSLSVPLIAGDHVLGAITFYSQQANSFGERFVLGQLIADLASTGMWCLLKHADKQQMTHQLEQALTSRATIDQAKGILIAKRGCSADEAFDQLRQTSQNHNIKLRDIAAKLVESAQRTS